VEDAQAPQEGEGRAPRPPRFGGMGRHFKRKLGDTALLTKCGEFKSQRRLFQVLPRAPRCRLCHIPFRGIDRLFKPFGYGPSRFNPNYCQYCFEWLPDGGYESEVGVLFVDIRGFTSMAEAASPSAVAEVLDRFYREVTKIVVARDALLNKFIGDEVMVLFLPGMLGDRLRPTMIDVACDLLRSVGYGSPEGAWLPIGIGMDFGVAKVGNVGAEGMMDFTAVGDVVNTASRLQGSADAGQILATDRLTTEVTRRWPNCPCVDLTLKGKRTTERTFVVGAAQAAGTEKSSGP